MSVDMKLGRWEARGGDVFNVSIHTPDAFYQWRADDGMCWKGNGAYWDDEKLSQYDLIRYLGPLELSPTPASAEAGPAGDLSTVSTEDPQESLRRMRAQCNALTREEAAYLELLVGVRRAKSDLEEAIKTLEKEVEG